MLERHLGENRLGRFLLLVVIAIVASWTLVHVEESTGWLWITPVFALMMPLAVLILVLASLIWRKDMTNKPYAYSVRAVLPDNGFGVSTAALMTCMVTDQMLSSSGGGGDYISPGVYEVLKNDPEVRDLIREKVSLLNSHPVG